MSTFGLALGQLGGTIEQIGIFAVPIAGSVTLAYAIFSLISDLRKPETKRVAGRLRENAAQIGESASERAAKASILRRQQRAAGGLTAVIANLGFIPSLQRMLDQADIQWTAPTLLVHLLGLAAAACVAAYVFEAAPWVSAVLAVAALALPLLAIAVRRRMRLHRFMHQLPDVFELMSQALRAGHSLANAILTVSQQLPDPVGTEFARVFHEQNLGIKIEDALKDMARRVGIMDVQFFVTAVLIQRQTGGDLAEVLDNISGVIRDRIKLFGSVKALTAEGRLSGYVLLALPVVVFLLELVINPNYAQIMLDEPIGRYMLIGAGVSQVLGLLMIQKIVNIKV